MGAREGWPAFHMLDSTDPAAVAAVDAAIDLPHTLFVLASKSGGTIEPNAMAAHFRARLEAAAAGPWAKHFIAITDEGTALHARAMADGYREIFVNPSDIGGRYSVLSFFGLVPAALMGHDAAVMVDWARAMLWLCGPGRPLGTNSAVLLGAAMAHGRHAWPRQDHAVHGAAPVPRSASGSNNWWPRAPASSAAASCRLRARTLGPPAEYGRDRVMVRLDLAGEPDAKARETLRDIAADGTPFVQIDLPEPEALAAEFLRWELATAVAGVVLGVNPFDEPNVTQAKEATGRLLAAYAKDGALPAATATVTLAGQTAALSAAANCRARTARRQPLPRDCWQRATTSASSPTSGPTRRWSRRSKRCAHASAADALREHVRLRPALPAFDGPAPQGRREQRRLPGHQRRAGQRPAGARRRRSVSASWSRRRPRRFRVARRGRAGARCTCTWRGPDARLIAGALRYAARLSEVAGPGQRSFQPSQTAGRSTCSSVVGERFALA